MYLVTGDYGNFRQIMTYKQMYEMLIDEIVTNSKENYYDYEILFNNLDQLAALSKNNIVNEKYVIDNLKSYGWNVININDLITKLAEIREYAARQTTPNLKPLDEIIKYLDEELK